MEPKQKVLIYDIENSPTVITAWKLWETDAIETLEEWYILSFAYKWLGEDKVHVVSLPDFPNYKRDKKNDKELLKVLHGLFNEADVLVAHNGDQHDQKKSNARFIYHGLLPPSPYKSVDTLKVARRYFKFNSNSLNSLGTYLQVGEKVKHSGMEIWRGCMNGDMASWATMCKYNKQDVVLLEKVYYKLLPWMTNHPTLNSDTNCRNCDSKKLQKRGFRYSRGKAKQQYQCQNCFAWMIGK